LDDDLASGTIYIARILSGDAIILTNHEALNNFGVSGGDLLMRVAGAKKGSTLLLAEAGLVATYKLANINRKGLEPKLHKFVTKARLDVAIAYRCGAKVRSREWRMVNSAVAIHRRSRRSNQVWINYQIFLRL